MTLHSTHSTASSPATTNRENLIEDLSQLPLIGEVFSWSLLENRGLKNSYIDVTNSLQQNGLDSSIAKEFTPPKAFTRACMKLKEQRVIDVIRNDSDEILFQFSKRSSTEDTDEGGTEYEYRKEAKILLNKSSGQLSCKDPSLKEHAQKLLDQCMEERTTGDITNILDKLFKVNSDLIPIGNGVFFIPSMYISFNEKVEGFMKDLGRKVVRLPVPKGTAVGDKSVQEVVFTHMKKLIDDMKGAVNCFTPKTRESTQDAMVERINSTRTKAEAYVTLLGDYQEEILQAVEEVNTTLTQRIDELDEERKNNPDLSSNISHMAEKIMTVASGTPKSPKQFKIELGWEISQSINSALVKLIEQGKLTKSNGGYVKV